jgi:16S rRNA (adenine1518-N6/adenine1519-N6)-dimethyltransferase
VAGLTGDPAESDPAESEPAESKSAESKSAESGPLGAARLLGPTEIRGLAARLGLQPSKRLGQNFVVDAGTVTRITALAKVGPADVVLEVGPGFGSLTLPLLAAAGRVVAVEMDRTLARQLPLTVADRAPWLAGRLEVVTADAARVTELPGEPPTTLVANLPYNVAVPVVLHLLATVPSLRRGLVMVQAEVADRMCAPPGSRTYGVPSAKLAWFGTARRAGSVPRGVFWPVPRVDSGLVELTRHEPGAAAGGAAGGAVGSGAAGAAGAAADGGADGAVGRDEVFAVIDAAFSQRRKTLRSALANWAGSAAAAESVLRAAGVDPSLRGEALGISEFTRIAAAAADAHSADAPSA